MQFPTGLTAVAKRALNDTVIVSALRTPICRANKQFKQAYPEELLSSVINATLERLPQLNRAQIEDVAVGVVLSELGGSKAARMALLHVGLPVTSSLYTVNRACASSLQSIALIAAQIQTGAISIGIGAGMESMTRNYGTRAIPQDVWPQLKKSTVQNATDCLLPMGLTSDYVASRYGISRRDQDVFAVQSHLKTARARETGAFKDEIAPVSIPSQVTAGENIDATQTTITISEDDGIRPTTNLQSLEKLKPAFQTSGTGTAGNSSQISDGAAAALLMRRSVAQDLGVPILGKFVGATVVGCRPDEMGIGPALAIPKLLSQHNLSIKDIDRWELNEAFASQALYCLRALDLTGAYANGRVNPDGGAIALGHPLGATGARMVSTLIHGLGRTGGELGVASMCVGTGMGMAALFVRE